MISIIFPTRGRVNRLKNMISSYISDININIPIEFLFYIDIDDHETQIFINLITSNIESRYNFIKIRSIIGERVISPIKMANALAKEATYDILFITSDDTICRSPRWTTKVLEVFNKVNDKIILAYPDDGFQHNKIAVHHFLHKDWIKEVGYLHHEAYIGDFADNHVMDIAVKINRLIYIPDLLFEHLHWTNNKAILDSTYIEKMDLQYKNNPELIYKSLEDERKTIATRLLKVINDRSKL